MNPTATPNTASVLADQHRQLRRNYKATLALRTERFDYLQKLGQQPHEIATDFHYARHTARLQELKGQEQALEETARRLNITTDVEKAVWRMDEKQREVWSVR